MFNTLITIALILAFAASALPGPVGATTTSAATTPSVVEETAGLLDVSIADLATCGVEADCRIADLLTWDYWRPMSPSTTTQRVTLAINGDGVVIDIDAARDDATDAVLVAARFESHRSDGVTTLLRVAPAGTEIRVVNAGGHRFLVVARLRSWKLDVRCDGSGQMSECFESDAER